MPGTRPYNYKHCTFVLDGSEPLCAPHATRSSTHDHTDYASKQTCFGDDVTLTGLEGTILVRERRLQLNKRELCACSFITVILDLVANGNNLAQIKLPKTMCTFPKCVSKLLR